MIQITTPISGRIIKIGTRYAIYSGMIKSMHCYCRTVHVRYLDDTCIGCDFLTEEAALNAFNAALTEWGKIVDL